MSEKSDIIKMESGEHKSKLVGISLLLLSVLLVGSVAAVIFLAVNGGGAACSTAADKSSSIDLKTTVNLKSSEGEKQETIEYSEGSHISYFYGKDGSFDMNDLRKGISVTKDNEDGVCYIIPVGANQTRNEDVKEFLQTWDGKDVNVEDSKVEVQIFENKLTDTSFLPQRAHDECTNGYKWMAFVRTGGSMEVEKRSLSCHYHIYYFWCYDSSYNLGICRLILRHCV